MPEFILYHGWTSSASRKVRLCLAEKGIEWEGRHLDLAKFEHHAEAFKKMNPSGKVPALLIDGVPFVESNQINEYLDDMYPEPSLMPSDPRERYEIRLFSLFIDSACLPAIQKHNWMRRFHPFAKNWSDEELEERLAACPTEERRKVWYRMARDPYTAEELEEALNILRKMADQMEEGIQKTGWTIGSAYSLADIAAVPYVKRLEEVSPEDVSTATRSGLTEWWARIQARPAYPKAGIAGYDEQCDPNWQIPA